MPAVEVKGKAGLAQGERVFKRQGDQREWLVRREWRDPTPAGEPGQDQLSVHLAIVPVDAPDAEPLWVGWTFTEEQLADPAFNPEAFVAGLRDQGLERASTVIDNRAKLKAARDKGL